MKKITILVGLLSIMFLGFSHSIIKQCWSNQRFYLEALQGSSNGKIEVTIYTNSDRQVIVENTKTHYLNATGGVFFNVKQPNLVNAVFVYIRWFNKNLNGNYVPTTWNSGQGYNNSYSSSWTDCNQCPTLSINNYDITYYRLDYRVNIYLKDIVYDSAILQYSLDRVNFVDIEYFSSMSKSFLLTNIVVYVRVRYVVNNLVKYSQILKFENTDKIEIDFSKPYFIIIYDNNGFLLKVINNRSELPLLDKDKLYILQYIQNTNGIAIKKTIKFLNI